MVNVDLSVVGAILNETGRLKTSIPIDNMMLLGAYRFCLKNASYQTLKRQNEYKWAELERINTKPCFCVPHTYASATTAMRIAKSKLAALIRGIYELELTVAGNTAICAESIIKISNLTQAANREWIIKSATHELSGSGYVTQINAIIKD